MSDVTERLIDRVARAAFAPLDHEPSEREVEGARAAVGVALRELSDEFDRLSREKGGELWSTWSEDYHSGYVQGTADASSRLEKWAKEAA